MNTKVNEIKISYLGGVKINAETKITSSSVAVELLVDQWEKKPNRTSVIL